MTDGKANMEILLDRAHNAIERALAYPGEIEFHAPFLACAGWIGRHTDALHFPEWSAFLCLRNDGCTVWQKGGWRGTPQPGEFFMVNIHQPHGVLSKRKLNVLAVMCADGRTQQSAERKLMKAIRAELRDARKGN